MQQKNSTRLTGIVFLFLLSISFAYAISPVSGNESNTFLESKRSPKNSSSINSDMDVTYDLIPAPSYSELMKTESQWDFFGNPLSDSSISATTRQIWYQDSNLIVNIDTDRRVYSPGDSINFIVSVSYKFQLIPGARVNVSLFEGENWWWFSPFYYYEFKPPILLQSMVLTTDNAGQVAGSFKAIEEGFYSILVEVVGYPLQELVCPDCTYARAYKTIQVSDLAVFWRVPTSWTQNEEISSYVVVRKTEDFSYPVDDAKITITLVTGAWWEEEQPTETIVYTGNTDETGLSVAKFTIPELLIAEDYYYNSGYATLSVEKNGKTTQTTQWVSLLTDSFSMDYYYGGATWSGQYEFVVTTDKSVYQPGQPIQTRVLVFENSYYNASRHVASAVPVTIDFIDPEGFHLVHRQQRTDENGILLMDFHLDKDAAPGTYQIIYSIGNSEEVIEIPVRFYQRPAFRVSIEAGRYYQPGQTIVGNISAEYYFGQPVHGTYEIHLNQLTEGDVYRGVETIIVPVIDVAESSESGEEENEGSESQASEETELGKDLAVIKGELNKEGFAEFALEIPKELEPHPGMVLQLTGKVIDVVDREVSASQTISMSPEIFVWAYADPYYAELGEVVVLHFFVSDSWWWWGVRSSEESSVANSEISVEVYSRRDGERETLVYSASTTADELGQGELVLDLPEEIAAEYKEFIATIKAETPDGRVGDSQVWFQYTVFDFDIMVSPERINSGEEILLTLDLTNKLTGEPEKAKVIVSAYDSDYERIGEADITLEGTKSFPIQLTSLAPKGIYRISAWVTEGYDTSRYGLYRDYGWAETTFYVGKLPELNIIPDRTTYNVEDTASISVEVDAPVTESILPIYLEISKRGILSLIVVESSSFTLELPLTYIHSPKIFLNAFAITSSGTVLMASSEIQIDFELVVNIEADKEIYAPRETAKISITVEDGSGTRIPAMTSLALVDSSVYGVFPDPEREREFFIEEEFYSTLTTRISWFSPQMFYPIWGIRGGFLAEVDAMRMPMAFAQEETIELAPAAPGAIQATKSAFPEVQESEIRKNLPESAAWRPKLSIGSSGELTLELQLPDNIGEWTIRMVSNVQGHGSLDKITIKTFKDFFIELKHPLFAYQDDIFEIQGLLYNYGQDATAQATLRLEGEGQAYVVNAPTQVVPIFEDEITIIRWYIFASEPGLIVAITTAAADDDRIDGLQKHLTIKPNAVLFENRFAGVVNDTLLTYYLDAESIEHSVRLTIVPGFTGAALEGWNRLIGYPYGCTEQTMSRLLPSAVVYKYLQETEQLDSDTQEQIEDMILAGISRLYAFHHSDGGWGWWEKDESNVHMTAIVLYGLGIIKNLGFSIEPRVIESAISYLLKQQRDEHWTMEGRGWEIKPAELSAFIVRAIVTADISYASEDPIQDALTYLEDLWESSQNPYFGGLLGQTLLVTETHQELFSKIIAYLIDSYQLDGNMIYWGETNWWYWRALGGPVETTSIIIHMLLDSKLAEYYLLANRAANWLMSRQNRYGWGTTSDTSAAVLAITTLAKQGGADVDSTVYVTENERITHEFQFSSNAQAERIRLNPQVGTNTVEIDQEGTGVIFYHLEVSSYVRTELQPEFPSTIEGTINQVVSLPIDLQFDETSPVLPVDLQIQVEDWDESLELLSEPTIYLEQLSSLTSVSFDFSSNQAGTYLINQIRLQYNLANREDLLNRAPATISRNFGPISLIIQEQTSELIPAKFQQVGSSINYPNPKSHQKALEKTNEDIVSISRTYSKTTGIKIGETISVIIEITNGLNRPLTYLVCEDPLLPWFILDDYALESSKFSWTVASDRLTFFIPSIDSGQTINIVYGIIAIGSVDVSAAATIVSSMYSALEYRGVPTRLSTEDIPQLTFKEGVPQLDISPPSISEFEISNTNPEILESIRISARVTDDHAVRKVTLWYKLELGDVWNKQIMEASGEILYETTLSFSKKGLVYFFLQAEDWVYNSITTELDSITVGERKFIPSLSPFTGFTLGVAVLIAGFITYRVLSNRRAR